MRSELIQAFSDLPLRLTTPVLGEVKTVKEENEPGRKEPSKDIADHTCPLPLPCNETQAEKDRTVQMDSIAIETGDRKTTSASAAYEIIPSFPQVRQFPSQGDSIKTDSHQAVVRNRSKTLDSPLVRVEIREDQIDTGDLFPVQRQSEDTQGDSIFGSGKPMQGSGMTKDRVFDGPASYVNILPGMDQEDLIPGNVLKVVRSKSLGDGGEDHHPAMHNYINIPGCQDAEHSTVRGKEVIKLLPVEHASDLTDSLPTCTSESENALDYFVVQPLQPQPATFQEAADEAENGLRQALSPVSSAKIQHDPTQPDHADDTQKQTVSERSEQSMECVASLCLPSGKQPAGPSAGYENVSLLQDASSEVAPSKVELVPMAAIPAQQEMVSISPGSAKPSVNYTDVVIKPRPHSVDSPVSTSKPGSTAYSDVVLLLHQPRAEAPTAVDLPPR